MLGDIIYIWFNLTPLNYWFIFDILYIDFAHEFQKIGGVTIAL